MTQSSRSGTQQAEQSRRTEQKIQDAMLHVLREAKVPPEFIHAFEKTGRLVTAENAKSLSEVELAEWDAAVAEYRSQTGVRRRGRR